jgi:polyhydroxybutyrate depolymerase
MARRGSTRSTMAAAARVRPAARLRSVPVLVVTMSLGVALVACGASSADVVGPLETVAATSTTIATTIAPTTTTSTTIAPPAVDLSADEATLAPGTSLVTLTVGGRTRSAVVHVPPKPPTAPLPLVLALHGSTSNGVQMERKTGFDALADRDDFIVAYPNGYPAGGGTIGSWNAGTCCDPATSIGIDDVAFLDALINLLEGSYPIDPGRVYAVGHSNGAMMAQELACRKSERIVAVASVAGTLGITDCRPSEPVALLEVHGTDDSSVDLADAERSVARWRVFDGCGDEDEPVAYGFVQTRIWTGCDRGTEVSLVEIVGAEHPWPGARTPAPDGKPTSTALDATELAWSFLSANSRAS